MKRSPLHRKTPLRPSRKRKPSERERSGAWRDAVMRASDGLSVLSGEPADECHHAVAKSYLRRHGLGAHVWDPRNGVALTTLEHARHTNRFEVLPLSVLPATVFEFVQQFGFGDYLERHYTKG